MKVKAESEAVGSNPARGVVFVISIKSGEVLLHTCGGPVRGPRIHILLQQVLQHHLVLKFSQCYWIMLGDNIPRMNRKLSILTFLYSYQLTLSKVQGNILITFT